MSKKTPKIQFSKKFHTDVEDVWNVIGPDVLDMEDLDNYTCVECVLDAGRLKEYGSVESDNELKRLIQEHGYPAVFEAAIQTFSLY